SCRGADAGPRGRRVPGALPLGPAARPGPRAGGGAADRAADDRRPVAAGPDPERSEWMSRIERVLAWEALDSRGRPTVAARVELAGGATGTTRVPSGASAGSHEARELRDGGDRYQGYGVRAAVAGVLDHLTPAVTGLDAADLIMVDRAIERAQADAGEAKVGANSTLAVSIATALAAAADAGVDLARYLAGDGPLLLPMPMI